MDVLSAVAATEARISFISDGRVTTATSLWDRSRGCVERFADHAAVAAVLTTTPEAVAVLFGAIRAGTKFVSLPLPPRGPGIERYIDALHMAIAECSVDLVCADNDVLPLLPPFKVPTINFTEALKGKSSDRCFTGFQLVQFSSGTTGSAKGIVISESALIANLAAIVQRIPSDQQRRLVSWLPLSHDMGLVGAVLSSLWACQDLSGFRPEVVLMRPEHFIRRPADWLRACSDFRATITVAPDFGFRRVAESNVKSIDLSSLGVCLTGGEPVRSDTLRLVDERFQTVGLQASAMCPAYGCAEATLAVSIHHPGTRWRSTFVDFGDGVSRTTEVVSSGRCLEGVDLKIDGAPDSVGPISVRSPSLLTSYIDGKDPTIDGWFCTGDFGFIKDDDLYVLGRTDDIIVAAGRNYDAGEIQRIVERIAGVRRGAVAAVADPVTSGYVVLCEVLAVDYQEVCSDIRLAIGRFGFPTPNGVAVVSGGSMPRTPSGKPRRYLAERLFAGGELPVTCFKRFRPM
jgi:acyl-CoA synthetase (AMP-forming)/AMP-acid ligase II